MILQDVLLPEFIKVNMEAEDKDEAFEELVDYYCQADDSNARDEILDAIQTREAKMSTGIHKGIAVPHGKTAAWNYARRAWNFPEGNPLRRVGRGACLSSFHDNFPNGRFREVPAPVKTPRGAYGNSAVSN